jgi:radical SAM-linked protein
MEKMRIAVGKTETTKYVGHLDFCRAVERALRRAKLPVMYSVGFNPHMRLSFGPALSVGVASAAEYVDVELTEPVDEAEFGRRLQAQLPPGLVFVAARPVSSSAALAAALNLAEYEITGSAPATPANLAAAASALAGFHAAETVTYVRRTPKGEKTLEVKQYLVGPIGLAAKPAGLAVTFRLRMTAQGAVKPQEVLRLLQDRFAFPAGAAACRRIALWSETPAGCRDPFEI